MSDYIYLARLKPRKETNISVIFSDISDTYIWLDQNPGKKEKHFWRIFWNRGEGSEATCVTKFPRRKVSCHKKIFSDNFVSQNHVFITKFKYFLVDNGRQKYFGRKFWEVLLLNLNGKDLLI